MQLIIEQHKLAGRHGLALYLGAATDAEKLLRPEDDYGLSLASLKVPGGSLNDHVTQIVTYEYKAHQTATASSMPPSRNYGVLHLPKDLMLAPLRQSGPC